MDVYSHLLAERVIYLGTGIDAGVANALIAQLLHLDADSPESGIQFYINSEGGDPGAALAIYDTMRHIRPRIATTCVGQAIGPAALLVAAGDSGERAALAHARIVLHQPAGQSRGAIPDLILAADEVVRVRSDMEGILAEHTGRTVPAARRHRPRPGLHRIRRPGLRPDRHRAGRAHLTPPRTHAAGRMHDSRTDDDRRMHDSRTDA